MTDPGPQSPTNATTAPDAAPPSPARDLERYIAAYGNAARPSTYYAGATTLFVAVVILCWRIPKDKLDGTAIALILGVLIAGISAIYIGKSVENANVAKNANTGT